MRIWKRILAAALIFCMVFTFAGCRYSDTLEQLIYKAVDEGFIDLDPPFEIANNSPENEDQSEILPDITQEEDIDRKDEPEEVGLVTEDADSEDDTDPDTEYDTDGGYTVQYDESGDSIATATDSGTTSDTTESTPSVIGDSEETIDEAVTAGTDDTEEGVDGETGDGGETEVAGNEETNRQVVNDYGGNAVYVQVGSVAAVGEIAVITSMLGGGSELLATDEETLALAASNSVFSDLSGAEAVWSGDGSGGLTSDGLERLLELKPDAVVYTSGSGCISESDADTLIDAGINCLVVPALTSVENIETTVEQIGNLLGQAEDGDQYKEKAEEYVSWVDDAMSYVSSKTGSDPMYTLYISDWDEDAVYTMTSSIDQTVQLSGTGCAIVENFLCDRTVLMTSLLSYAGITNTASKEYNLTAAKLYTTPLRYSYGSLTVSGSKASNSGFNNSNSKYLETSYTVSLGGDDTDTVTTSLGLSTFPCVIAANSDVKAGILSSKSQTKGQWALYGHINNADNTFNSDAFLDSAGRLVRTQISGDYDVLVNPSGLRSWTDGSAESVLEAIWAAYAVRGAISESEVRTYISDFYTEFYGYTPSSSEISSILAGE